MLFDNIIEALNLESQLESVTKRYADNEQAFNDITTPSHNNEMLATEYESPAEFAKVRDHLFAHLNVNLDTIHGSDATLAALLEADKLAAQEFTPKFVSSKTPDGSVVARVDGVGLTIGLYSTAPWDEPEPESIEEIINGGPEEDSDLPYQPHEVAMLIVYDDDTITLVEPLSVESAVSEPVVDEADVMSPAGDTKVAESKERVDG